MTETIHCNMCGTELDEWDTRNDLSLRRCLGYGSKYDGEIIDLNLCCECMDGIIEKCKVSPLMDSGNENMTPSPRR